MTGVQAETLDRMTRGGVTRRLVRWTGGFWTIQGYGEREGRPGVPEWWITVGTVRAMERKGLIARAHEMTDEWRDPRVVVAR